MKDREREAKIPAKDQTPVEWFGGKVQRLAKLYPEKVRGKYSLEKLRKGDLFYEIMSPEGSRPSVRLALLWENMSRGQTTPNVWDIDVGAEGKLLLSVAAREGSQIGDFIYKEGTISSEAAYASDDGKQGLPSRTELPEEIDHRATIEWLLGKFERGDTAFNVSEDLILPGDELVF